MVRPSRDVTSAELAILERLWDQGTSAVKVLAQNLYGASSPSDIATVQKLLSRLEAKGFVVRDRDSWPHEFHAAVQRDALITQRLQATADELCDGALSNLVTNLVKAKKLNSKQRKRIRNLLDELDDE